MSYYETGQDILIDVLQRGGERTALTGGNTSDYLIPCKRYVQRAYEDILAFAPWPWALKNPPGILNISAKKTNTATITSGSTSVTLGTSISTSVSGWWLLIDAEQVPYRITAHTAGTTSVTIDATYKEDSVSAGACSIFKDEYSLADDCLKLWRAWDRNNPYREIDIIQRGEMSQTRPNRYVSSSVTLTMSVIRDNMVRITPFPLTDDLTVEYEYSVKPAQDFTFDEDTDTDIPILPLVDRHVIADSALVLLYIEKNDNRTNEMSQIALAKLQLMFNTYCIIGKYRRYVPRGKGIWQ